MIIKPKGCHDLYGSEMKKWQYVNEVIDSLMKKYNYNLIRTPLFEASELFHRGVGETTDIVTKETYDFIDRGDRKMTLRPEGTAGVVRWFVENKMYAAPIQPVKVYYNGTMYRYERPQSGRDRELTQFGVEVLGSDDSLVDAEVISIPVNLFKMLGLKEIKVHINSLGDSDSRDKHTNALKEHFKPVLNELCLDCQKRYEKNPLRILDCKVDQSHSSFNNAPKTLDYLNEESKTRFEKVLEYLAILEIEYELNSNLVRGLDYYNHTVFEIEAKVEGFGSQNVLCGGGRYNQLTEMLGGPVTPGMGFAVGLGRIIMALNFENVKLPIQDDVDVFIMYVNDDEKKTALYLTQELRLNGFSVETDYLKRNLKGQFKQADKFNSKYLIILNSEDLDNNIITIKNNKTKKEDKVELDYLIYYLDEQILNEDDDDDCSCGNCDHECGDNCSCENE